jgi:phage replication-related protein YjqB (UPF0714/DUF867 family)
MSNEDSLAKPLSEPGGYQSFSELLYGEVEGRDFSRIVVARSSPVVIVALHGGGIEPGTSEIARAIAGSEYSLYCFESLKTSGNELLHIPSHDFDDPLCLKLIKTAQVVISVHGCSGEDHQAGVFIGGRHSLLREQLSRDLQQASFPVAPGPGRYPGQHRDNVCNLGQAGKGIQLEISKGLRDQMFAGMRRQERKITRPAFDRFVQTVRAVLQTAEKEGYWESPG